jgi:hypothetical protein
MEQVKHPPLTLIEHVNDSGVVSMSEVLPGERQVVHHEPLPR